MCGPGTPAALRAVLARLTTNAQYLRAGGGCSSMLIRRKSSTDDECHHEDLLCNFWVVIGANGGVLWSNV